MHPQSQMEVTEMSEEVKINEENQYSFENPEYRKTYWHTCSHVLAQAVSLMALPLMRPVESRCGPAQRSVNSPCL